MAGAAISGFGAGGLVGAFAGAGGYAQGDIGQSQNGVGKGIAWAGAGTVQIGGIGQNCMTGQVGCCDHAADESKASETKIRLRIADMSSPLIRIMCNQPQFRRLGA